MFLTPLVFKEQTIHNGYVGQSPLGTEFWSLRGLSLPQEFREKPIPNWKMTGTRNKNNALEIFIACLAFRARWKPFMCNVVSVFEEQKLDSCGKKQNTFWACYLSFLWWESIPTIFQRASAIYACAHTPQSVWYLSVNFFLQSVRCL